jgi:hypothetical protein
LLWRPSSTVGGGSENCGDPTSFFKHAIRKQALCGRPLLELLISDGDDFGIPPLRLVPGKYLEQLGRFPRSNEHEVVCSAVPVPLRPNHPTPSEMLSDFGVTFVRCVCSLSLSLSLSLSVCVCVCVCVCMCVCTWPACQLQPREIDCSIASAGCSHRWAQSDAPDTLENAQCRALIEYLNSDANPTKDTWTSHYFWIDWSSIDQDSNAEKQKMINGTGTLQAAHCCHLASIEPACGVRAGVC